MGVASALVAVRLLLLYGRLQEPPELFLGLAYLLAGTWGWGGLLIGVLSTAPNQRVSNTVEEVFTRMGVDNRKR